MPAIIISNIFFKTGEILGKLLKHIDIDQNTDPVFQAYLSAVILLQSLFLTQGSDNINYF